MSFNSLGLQPDILETLAGLGLENPTEIQAQSIPHILQGRDLVGLSQSGSGKTFAFGLPLIQISTREAGIHALIVAPSRELATQIQKDLIPFSFSGKRNIGLLTGGTPVKKQLQQLIFEPNIVVATPGRLLEVLKKHPQNLSRVQQIVFDEADRILDMGFLSEVQELLKLVPKDSQRLLFSASYSLEVERLVLALCKNPVKIEIGEIARPTSKVSTTLHQIEPGQKKNFLFDFFQKHPDKKTIIFARTKKQVEAWYQFLSKFRDQSDFLHGGRLSGERKVTLQKFRDGTTQVLVCTDLAARGLHIEDIEYVINLSLPDDPDNYVHRIGRAGRGSLPGFAFTLISRDELSLWERISNITKPSFETRVFSPDHQLPDLLSHSLDEFEIAPVKETKKGPKKGHVKVFTSGSQKVRKKGKRKNRS